jgi:hypothetical protein
MLDWNSVLPLVLQFADIDHNAWYMAQQVVFWHLLPNLITCMLSLQTQNVAHTPNYTLFVERV